MVNGASEDATSTLAEAPVGAAGLFTDSAPSSLDDSSQSQPAGLSSSQPLQQRFITFPGQNGPKDSSHSPGNPATTFPPPPSPSSSSSTVSSSPPPAFHFLAGLCTGSLSAFLLQPADLLKTRVQQARGLSATAALRDILSQPAVLRQLWRGTLPSVIRTGFGSALYFASLNILRANWPGKKTEGVGMAAGADEKEAELRTERKRWAESGNRDMRSELSKVVHLARTNREPVQPGKGGGMLAGELMPSERAGSVPGPALDSTVSVHTPPPRDPEGSSPFPQPASLPSSPSSSALPKLGNTANLVTGALARAGAGFIMMPITVLKVRYESSLYASYGTSTGLVGAARAIVSREGIRGLYAGYGATLARDAPHAGLYVVFYEQAKAVIAGISSSDGPGNDNEKNNSSGGSGGGGLAAARSNFAAGVVAAAAATAVTNPFDAVKTRIQLMPDRYANTAAAAATILRHEGPRALFDGLALRMARKALSSALAWTIYEDLVRRAEIRYAEVAAVANATEHAAT